MQIIVLKKEGIIMSVSVAGLISGIDYNNIIDELLALQQKPIIKLQHQEAAYQVELSAYGSLQSTLSILKSAMDDLDSVSNFTSFSATSSNPDLFTVSADENASAGSYNVTVQNLAEVHKLTSKKVGDGTTSEDGAFADGEYVGKGTIHLKVGSGSTMNIAVSATDTIEEVAQSINDAGSGVHASVIFDGTYYFLTLTADEPGVENVINLTVTETGDPPIDIDMIGLSRLVYNKDVTENLENTQTAADSKITVNGVSNISRDTNVIDDVIEGVTITLESAPVTDNEATLSVSRDTAAVISKINSFVSAYNNVLDFFDTYQNYNQDTKSAGVLLGDAITNNIHSSLDRLVTGTVPGVELFSRLSDFGIRLNDEGRLEVDSSALNGALDDNFDDVVKFFTQTTKGSEGFAVRMVDTLDAILDDSTGGTLDARTDGIQNSIDDIQDQVERIEIRNLAWETRTRTQFNALELLVAGYQNTGNYLSQQILGMQNLNNYISNRG
jgi:flagellar hook-associated protein 2